MRKLTIFATAALALSLTTAFAEVICPATVNVTYDSFGMPSIAAGSMPAGFTVSPFNHNPDQSGKRPATLKFTWATYNLFKPNNDVSCSYTTDDNGAPMIEIETSAAQPTPAPGNRWEDFGKGVFSCGWGVYSSYPTNKQCGFQKN